MWAMGAVRLTEAENLIVNDQELATEAFGLIQQYRALQESMSSDSPPENLEDLQMDMTRNVNQFMGALNSKAQEAGIGAVQGYELGQLYEKNRCACAGGMVNFDKIESLIKQ